ncbi:MAG: alpha/beta fold hydrolase [Microbacterium sp.]|uniref:alpha/beta fold hydrolase n=1 Tax=Microbacterium sp. TaxID=51671 RepID=UPI0039E22A22
MRPSSGGRPCVVLVHGAWASAWVWDPITAPLADAGYDVVAVTLPDSTGPESESGLESQVQAVLDASSSAGGRLFLVGHSGGGIVVTVAADRMADRVAGVVFVAGIMLPSGVGFDVLRAELGTEDELMGAAPFLERALDGRGTVVPPDAAVAVLFQRADPAAAIGAARRLQPQWDAGLDVVPVWRPEGFGALRRLYIEATDDRDIPLAVQRHMQRRTPGATVVTLDADHAPQLSAPDGLVSALLGFFDAV